MKSDMKKGAQQAAKLLNIKKGEKVVIITDKETESIANAIHHEILGYSKDVEIYYMEGFGERPVKFNDFIKQRILNADVAYYIAKGVSGELQSFRMPLIDAVRENKKIRYAHMINVEEGMMSTGMAVDYDEVNRVSKKVYDIVSKSKEIHVTTPSGTDLKIKLNPKYKWINSDGTIIPGKWVNLPTGEVFTAPESGEGVIVVDGVLGDHFSHKYGTLEKTPVRINVKKGRAISVVCKNKELLEEFEKYIHQDENANRMGEVGIGTNVGLKKLIGNLLQDEKFPGVHIAFGDAYGKETGANWSSKGHVDAVMKECTILVDGKKIMEKGKFLI